MTGPMYVAWHYTYRCNYWCSHCYSRAAEYPAELPTEQYELIARQIVDSGAFIVALGGGEPLLRADCLDILGLLSAEGIETHLTTNGSTIDSDIAQRLASHGLARLNVSIDSANPAVHDEIRVEGSLDRCITAVRHARDHGIEVHLSSVVMSQNIDSLEEIVQLGEHLGAAGVHFKRFRTSGNGAKNASQHSPSPEAERRLESRLGGLIDNQNISVAVTHFDGLPSLSGEDVAECPCGKISICLRPNGDVSPCAYAETVLGNVQARSLSDIWLDSPVLTAMRSGAGCMGLELHSAPMNPYMAQAETP